ncbi:MAG TPA: hypothetical protein VFZ59_27335 [Verrucomicrobiae bacterium]|nr:hypothetical protein [Verrucomicrobiae bacterium]
MSEFKFACPVCGQHITCDSASSGTQMDCPTCFRKLVVPQAKLAGASNLVLTAALAQARPATSLSSQTELIAASRRGRKFPVAALVSMAVVVCAGAGVVAIRKTILQSHQSVSTETKQEVPGAKPIVHISPPAPDATNWTLRLAEAKLPEWPANGNVNGRAFQLERATIRQGHLDLRQGPKWPPDVGVSVHLFAERTEDLAGKKVTIEATRTNAPRTILRWKNENGDPATKDFRNGYALKVEFGQVSSNHLPGKIFIAFPDDPRSYVAGTFNAEIRRPNKK